MRRQCSSAHTNINNSNSSNNHRDRLKTYTKYTLTHHIQFNQMKWSETKGAHKHEHHHRHHHNHHYEAHMIHNARLNLWDSNDIALSIDKVQRWWRIRQRMRWRQQSKHDDDEDDDVEMYLKLVGPWSCTLTLSPAQFQRKWWIFFLL